MTSSDELEDELKILLILEAFELNGRRSTSLELLHAACYLTSALSPIFNLAVWQSAVLKRNGLPMLPAVQDAIDRSVARGTVEVVSFDVEKNFGSSLRASFRVRKAESAEALRRALLFPEDSAFYSLVSEVTASIRTDTLQELFQLDASYADPRIGLHRMIELSDGAAASRTADVARLFASVASNKLSEGEQVNLYIGHLDRLARRRHNA